MALKIYGHPSSICTRRVRTILEEKGVEYEFINVNFLQGEHLSEPYGSAWHPFKKIPVLVDTEADIKVFESRAIAQYIAAKYHGYGPDLSPPQDDLKKFAAFQQALSIELSYFDPNVGGIAGEAVFKPAMGFGPGDQAVIKTKLDALDTALQGYERILSQQRYLAGDEITLADLFHLPFGGLVEPLGFGELVAKYPAVEKWWNGLKGRESWKKVGANEQELGARGSQ
ncbi:glutathione S-transferase [Dactylonectria macrodidyma]|uniref:glutathione transferase n=1 Tax=Dactylonectria macrodidyma TaxID=307937 RepID=A0A9P9F8X0_9HYPO|nr:glutathione S-transferase [Dactylonectria macrodidyma]